MGWGLGMGHCKKRGCKFSQWRDRLCYRHYREAQGFTFNAVLKLFVKAGKKIA
jgi:hypothetical protein